jgi:hypothetical protein
LSETTTLVQASLSTGAATRLMGRTEGLAAGHLPMLVHLFDVGLKEKQVAALVDLIIGDTPPQGRAARVTHVLRSVMKSYSDNDFIQAAQHYSAERKLHRELREADGLCRDALETLALSLSFDQAMLFLRVCGKESALRFLGDLRRRPKVSWRAGHVLAEFIGRAEEEGRMLDGLVYFEGGWADEDDDNSLDGA